jgi:hypothetical protein
MNPPGQPITPPGPRGTRPDAETSDKLYLIKNVPALRATYQLRLLAFLAAQRGKQLVLQVPAACRFDPGLEAWIGRNPGLIQREDLP